MGRPESGLRATCRALPFRGEGRDVRQASLAGDGYKGGQPIHQWVTKAFKLGQDVRIQILRASDTGQRAWA